MKKLRHNELVLVVSAAGTVGIILELFCALSINSCNQMSLSQDFHVCILSSPFEKFKVCFALYIWTLGTNPAFLHKKV